MKLIKQQKQIIHSLGFIKKSWIQTSAIQRWSGNPEGDGILPYSAYAGSSAWDIRRFFEEVGTGAKEARFWLKLFQYRDAYPNQPFAVMQICQSTFNRPHLLSKLGSSLAFLQKNGLSTVLVHGLRDEEKDRDQESSRKRLSTHCLQVADALESQGAKATPFLNCSGIFKLVQNEDNSCALVCDTDPVKWSLSNGYIPVVSAVSDFKGRVVSICPVQACDELALLMKPLKIMYLNSSGGLHNGNGKVIEQISIPLDEMSKSEKWCTDEALSKVDRITHLLRKLPLTASAVITSADTLLKELFTHKGSGTIFKARENMCVHRSLETIDKGRLLNLLEETFKRKLRDDYFSKLTQKLDSAYITESYSAAAIITREPEFNFVPYLDKFVVVKENQGLGSGEILWDRLKRDYRSLFWRSRGRNRINPWYFARGEGSWADGDYTVFWYGVPSPDLVHKMIDFAVNHPSSFDEIWVVQTWLP